MLVGIIHLSDIHFNREENIIQRRIDKIISPIISELKNVHKVFCVVSGDIANSGKSDEYIIASEFLLTLKEEIEKRVSFCNSFKFIIVPGNHDNMYPSNDVVRKVLLDQVKNKDILEIAVKDALSSVQENFVTFRDTLDGDNTGNYYSKKVSFPLTTEQSLTFNLYNSSYQCTLDSRHKGIIISEDDLITNNSGVKNELVISVFHHPMYWYNPDTKNNNLQCFKKNIIKESNIILYGHEHEQDNFKIIAEETGETYVFSGLPFQGENLKKEGFGIIVYDTSKMSFEHQNYVWDKTIYTSSGAENLFISYKTNGLQPSKKFLESIDILNIPITHYSKRELKLSDIYVHPDLDPVTKKFKIVEDWINFEKVIGDDKQPYLFILGKNQCGKTSLLRQTFSTYSELGYYPLLIDAKDIKNRNIKNLIKGAVREQYDKIENLFDHFWQLDINKRVILIDNWNEITVGQDKIDDVLTQLKLYFSKIYITCHDSFDMDEVFIGKSNYSDFKQYKILTCGHAGMKKMIEKWIQLDDQYEKYNKIEFEKTVKKTLENLNILIGKHFVPPYPFFIWTLLQSINDETLKLTTNFSNYVNCYNSLINNAFNGIDIADSDKTAYINFLASLSYDMFNKNISLISEEQLENFYFSYKKEHVIRGQWTKIHENLTKSKLVKKCEDGITFPYKYIYYFLIAKKISTIIDREQEAAEDIIMNLCDNLHIEIHKNILTFLTYHSKHPVLLNTIIVYSEEPFSDKEPITLQRDCSYVEFLSNYINKAKTFSIDEGVDYKKKSEEKLHRIDKQQRKDGMIDSSIESDMKTAEKDKKKSNLQKEYDTAENAIVLLGQIIRNQHGDFYISEIMNFVKNGFLLGFRTIRNAENSFANYINNIQQNILKSNEGNDGSLDIVQARKEIAKEVSWMGLMFCYAIFTDLVRYLSIDGLDEIYQKIEEDLDSPATKLVIFAIKAKQEKINVNLLKELVEEFRHNYVALHILKANVKYHLYYHYVEPKKKQQIIDICDFVLEKKQLQKR